MVIYDCRSGIEANGNFVSLVCCNNITVNSKFVVITQSCYNISLTKPSVVSGHFRKVLTREMVYVIYDPKKRELPLDFGQLKAEFPNLLKYKHRQHPAQFADPSLEGLTDEQLLALASRRVKSARSG